MDGKKSHRVGIERPIAKPDYPLPALFSPGKRSELPTRRERKDGSAEMERAHFYRKQTSNLGSPVYGFVITTDQAARDAKQN
jgi:hypothetical protein